MDTHLESRFHEAFNAREKKKIFFSRNRIFLSFLCSLCLPIGMVALYGSYSGSKGIFFVALPVAAVASYSGWVILSLWEKKMRRSVIQLVNAKMEKIKSSGLVVGRSQQEIEKLSAALEEMKAAYVQHQEALQTTLAQSKIESAKLHLEIDTKIEEMRVAQLALDDLRKEYKRLEEESAHFLEEGQKQLKHKDSLLNEYQRTVSEQRMIIEKKQRYIAKLEGKVRDLMYEIRSLLQLESTPPGVQLVPNVGLGINEQAIIDAHPSTASGQHASYDFSIQLQKYIEKAESLTGVDHLGYVGGNSPRFLDLPIDGYAIDRRRLFDSFKDETGAALFIISPFEKKFLFVTPPIRSLCGWSQEKFMKEFSHLILRGAADWEEALAKIKQGKETSFYMILKSKTGEPKKLRCFLGAIKKGPFAPNALGLFVAA